MGANDDAVHPWLAPTKDLLREAARDAVPTLGVCLGHQLAAVALGGTVGRSPAAARSACWRSGGPGEAASDPLLASLATFRRAIQWNEDLVLEPSPGAVLLAATELGEIQAMRFAPTVWGVQWHPEATLEMIESWADERARPARGRRTDRRARGPDGARAFVARSGQGLRGYRDRMNRATLRSELLRHGFVDVDRAMDGARRARQRRPRAGRHPRPVGRAERRAVGAGAAGGRGRRPRRPADRARGRRRYGDAAALRARRECRTGRPPGQPPGALARAHRPDARHHPAGRVGDPRRADGRRRRGPGRIGTGRHGAGGRGRRRTAGGPTGDCSCRSPRATSPTSSVSTTSPPSSPTWRPAPSTPPLPSPGARVATTAPRPGSRSSRWASAVATSSTTSRTST